MKIFIPVYVEKIIERLQEKGFDAYAVGGSIRDSLMQKKPVDWDIATDAVPDEVISMFSDKNVIKTGEKYGTVTIAEDEGKIEVTVFRSEGGYADGRHPDWVRFENSIVTDLGRRDFTINAIAYNKDKGLVDPYNGINDIKNKILRAVGNPNERFREDSLRMLRAARFYTVLDFQMESKTKTAIKELAGNIVNVSPERVNAELFRILMNENPTKGVKMLLDTNLLIHLMPETHLVKEYRKGNKIFINHMLCILKNTPKVLHIRMAAIFSKPDESYGNSDNVEASIKIMKRLCCSNDLIEKVKTLMSGFESFNFTDDRVSIKKTIRSIGVSNIYDLIELLKAEALCNEDNISSNQIIDFKKYIDDIFENREPIELKDLDIGGNDIMNLGFEQGIIIGEILEDLMNIVLKQPNLNSKDRLIEIIKDKWL